MGKTSLRNAAARVAEPLFALPVVYLLHHYGLLGHAPPWLLMVLLTVSAATQQPEVQRRLAGGRLHLGVALSLGCVMLMTYMTGWGPLLTIVGALVATMHLRTAGGRVWRPVLGWTLVFGAIGQAGIALGWVFTYASPTVAQAGGLLGLQTSAILIRALGVSAEQRERAEAEVRSREERFRALVQDSSDAVSVVEAGGRTVYVSPAIEHITGLTPEEFVESEYSRRWVYASDLEAATAAFTGALADPGGEHRVELRMRHKDGDLRWMEVSMRNLIDSPAVGGLVITYRDVTERHAIQERLIHDANHDPLTGLANRAAFLRGLERSCAAGRSPAVMFVDLDGFKKVNDTLGHQAGDTLIIEVAGMLRRSVLGSDVVGRLGGDEFGVVLPGVASREDAATVARRILAEMDNPVLIDGREVFARASIGVAVAEPGHAGADELLHHADLAMYGAKRGGTHRFQLYTEGVVGAAATA
jgi:diguanylate cyclase (GGDEF)-like protein/PAS domain S-box-containing protein